MKNNATDSTEEMMKDYTTKAEAVVSIMQVCSASRDVKSLKSKYKKTALISTLSIFLVQDVKRR